MAFKPFNPHQTNPVTDYAAATDKELACYKAGSGHIAELHVSKSEYPATHPIHAKIHDIFHGTKTSYAALAQTLGQASVAGTTTALLSGNIVLTTAVIGGAITHGLFSAGGKKPDQGNEYSV